MPCPVRNEFSILTVRKLERRKELFADIKSIQYFSEEMGQASPRSLRNDGVEFYFANGDVGTIKWEDMGISIK